MEAIDWCVKLRRLEGLLRVRRVLVQHRWVRHDTRVVVRHHHRVAGRHATQRQRNIRWQRGVHPFTSRHHLLVLLLWWRPVSYTQPTLPRNREVCSFVYALSSKNKK